MEHLFYFQKIFKFSRSKERREVFGKRRGNGQKLLYRLPLITILLVCYYTTYAKLTIHIFKRSGYYL